MIPVSIETAFRLLVDRLLGFELPQDDVGDPQPRIAKLNAEAKRAWIAFYDQHAQEQAHFMGDLAAAWAKVEAYAARLALVVHLTRLAMSDPSLADPEQIDEKSIRAGVALARWFGAEAKRVYAVLAESETDRKRREFVESIERMGGDVTVRELTRSTRQFPTAASAEAALQPLAEDGSGYWKYDSPGPKGGNPSKRFILIDTGHAGDAARPIHTDADSTPAAAPKNGSSVNVNGINTHGLPHVGPDAAAIDAPRRPRQHMADLIGVARRSGDHDLAIAMRKTRRELVAICTLDANVSEGEAEEIARRKLKTMLH